MPSEKYLIMPGRSSYKKAVSDWLEYITNKQGKLLGKMAESCCLDELPNAKPSNYLGKITGDCDVDRIKKIIQNGPCTIVIDIYNNKTIVRPQEGEFFDRSIGFHLALIKYLHDSKRYSDIMTYLYPDGLYMRDDILTVCAGILIAEIGLENYFDLSDRFFDE